MDAGFLNFHKEEDFSSYFLDPCVEDSQSYDGIRNQSSSSYQWMDHLDYEQELNGDMGLIPVSGEAAYTLSTSPPIKEDFNKIMNDWNNLVNLDVGNELIEEMANTSSTMPLDTVSVPNEVFNIKEEGFDITKYVVGSESEITAGDLHSSTDDSVTENIRSTNLNSLGIHVKQEHFEVESDMHETKLDRGSLKKHIKQEPNFKSPQQIVKTSPKAVGNSLVRKPQFGGKRIDMAKGRYLVDESSEEGSDEDDIDVETVEEEEVNRQPVLQAGDLNSLLEQFEATETTNFELQQHTEHNDENPGETELSLDIFVEEVKIISPIKSPMRPKVHPSRKNKLDFREVEGISEIKVKVDKIIKTEHSVDSSNHTKLESNTDSKPSLIKDERKNKQILDALPVELIDRLRQSNKRKIVPLIDPIIPMKKRNTNQVIKDPITNSTLANKIINSNSVHKFISTGVPVKDTKSIQLDHDYCCSTPTKDSGFSSCEEDDKSIIHTQPTIKNTNGKLMVSLLKTNTIKKKLNLEEYKKRLQNRDGSGSNSPAGQEDDENARRLKHTEMLMKMAQDIIKQRNGSLQDVDEANILPQVDVIDESKIKKEKLDEASPAIKKPQPPSNIVMKTLVSMGTNTEESWGHIEQIFQSTQIKISPNSLISSIVEHLPKPVIKDQQVQHGEDKTIVYIDTTKPKVKMCNKIVQTIHSSSNMRSLRRRRRRRLSSASYTSCYSSDSDCSVDSMRDISHSSMNKQQLEQLKVVEERRVVYVGRITDSTTKEDLRKRFEKFGPIMKVSVHFRRHDVNYGFVTFMHKEDAYEAVEKGNSDKCEPQYDLSFGGRRLFCKTRYEDLDHVEDDEYEYWSNQSLVGMSEEENNTFDELLRKAQAKLRKRKL